MRVQKERLEDPFILWSCWVGAKVGHVRSFLCHPQAVVPNKEDQQSPANVCLSEQSSEGDQQRLKEWTSEVLSWSSHEQCWSTPRRLRVETYPAWWMRRSKIAVIVSWISTTASLKTRLFRRWMSHSHGKSRENGNLWQVLSPVVQVNGCLGHKVAKLQSNLGAVVNLDNPWVPASAKHKPYGMYMITQLTKRSKGLGQIGSHVD